ncbi:MAG: methyl-accepting chemotaxis protein [Nitrospirae bacterium]|nr:methyl-accepting chemotaxis protein [Nitrospirota bacterium]
MSPENPTPTRSRHGGLLLKPGRSILDRLILFLILSGLGGGVLLALFAYLFIPAMTPVNMTFFVAGSIFMGLLMALVSFLLMNLIVLRPLGHMVGMLRTFAEGEPNLRERLALESADLIGDIVHWFNAHLDRLVVLVRKILQSTELVFSSTKQVSSVTEDIAKKADESASKVGQVATSAEEMSATVLEIARNAHDAALAADEAKKTAVHGSDVVSETVTRMQEISAVVKESAQTVRRLGEKSEQIGKVVQVIDDIADQTNLLALNAAIEAARAGEQGRGFAVVADEVRKLAERTTRATKEIAETIRTIQMETSGAVDAMRRGVEKVDEGSTFATKAGEALSNILQGVEKVADMIGQIAASAEQQSAATEEISSNITDISKLSKETASGITEVSQAAEELKKLTVELMNLVTALKV